MKKILISFFAMVLLFGTIAGSALAVGNNGDFEQGTDPGLYATLYPGNTNITSWAVDSGSVDYIGTYWTGSNGPRSVDLNGFTQGSISQTITTVVGATYHVSFDLSGNPDSRPVDDPYYSPSNKVVRVSAGSAPSQDFSYDTASKGNTLGDMRWESHTYSFVATGTSTNLTFASQIAGAFGPALDNVVITESLPTQNFPTTKDQCKKGGWESFGIFKNQGDCVSFVATGGKNLPEYLGTFTASDSLYYNGPTSAAPLYGNGPISFTWNKLTGNVISGYYTEQAPAHTGTIYYNIVTSGTVTAGGVVNLTFDRTFPDVRHFTFTGTLSGNVLTGQLDGPYLFTATGL